MVCPASARCPKPFWYEVRHINAKMAWHTAKMSKPPSQCQTMTSDEILLAAVAAANETEKVATAQSELGVARNPMERRRLKPAEVAISLRVSTSTLSKWRKNGEGPPFHRCGRRLIFYYQDEIDAWQAECDRRSNLKHK
jgi:predicted DNA-binding transcriptional regulator AlpA